MVRYLLGLAAVVLIQLATQQNLARAADSASGARNRDEYRPPGGFGAYSWSTPLNQFSRLAPEPVYVRIAYADAKTTEIDFNCFFEGGALNQCTETEGEGFHAMAEYYVDSQGFRLSGEDGKSKTVLFPITYQFCAQWSGFSNNIGGDMLERLKFCGARLHFRSETEAQEQKIVDPNYITSSQRVLNWLIDNHGEPENYVRQGTVRVGGFDMQREIVPRKGRFDNWFWCRPKVDEVTPNPNCKASIVYTFDSETGRGQVIFLTAPVWTYAYARQYGGSEGDPLYRILHGNIEQAPVQHVCTGTFLCEPPPPKPMSEKMMSRFRLPQKAAAPGG